MLANCYTLLYVLHNNKNASNVGDDRQMILKVTQNRRKWRYLSLFYTLYDC